MERAFVVPAVSVALGIAAAHAADAPRDIEPPCALGCYVWSLSFSEVDPSLSTATPALIDTLYLWLACGDEEGMMAAEFALVVSGPPAVPLFQTMNGFLNAGTVATELELAVGGCPQGPVVAGRFMVVDLSGQGGAFCFGPASNGRNVTWECDIVPTTSYENGYTGASTDGTAPCEAVGSFACMTVAVEPSPWGSIKSLYR
jgi:hypothetical protein